MCLLLQRKVYWYCQYYLPVQYILVFKLPGPIWNSTGEKARETKLTTCIITSLWSSLLGCFEVLR